MKRKISKVLIASICLNAIMLLMLCGVAYYKREGIKNRIVKIFTPKNHKIEQLAIEMNQEVYNPIFGRIGTSDKVIKIAFIGNSLTLHGVSENIGWTHESGMAASSLENDYVHRVIEKISTSKNISVEYGLINTADFERNFINFDNSRLSKLLEFSPDYVIFQQGENVSSNDIKKQYKLYVEKYSDLIKNFDNSTKIVCLPFWYDKDKISVITEVAIKTNSFLVDLSHLGGGLDNRNYAISEVKYSHKGVGLHPGDFGMENISDNIFSVFNALIE